jgi:hypothetical protein
MPTWDEAKKLLEEAQTLPERVRALQALQNAAPPELLRSNLVTMKKGSANNVVTLNNLEQHADNPEVYDRIKRMVVGTK